MVREEEREIQRERVREMVDREVKVKKTNRELVTDLPAM